jgi:hypothetical protein
MTYIAHSDVSSLLRHVHPRLDSSGTYPITLLNLAISAFLRVSWASRSASVVVLPHSMR